MILNGAINLAKSFFGRCVGSVVTRSAIDTLKKYLRCGAWAQTIKEHQPASSPDVNTIMQTGTNVLSHTLDLEVYLKNVHFCRS